MTYFTSVMFASLSLRLSLLREMLYCTSYVITLFHHLSCKMSAIEFLKVPKREIFVTELFTLSDSIWVGELGTEAENRCLKFFLLIFAFFYR
jgi:hypothetical protein